MIAPREDYDHPGPLGPALDLSRVTGWDIHHTAGSHDESAYDVARTGVRRFGRSSYNFHIPSDGTINEMQGLHIGAHNDGENSTRLGVVFPGYFHPPHNHELTDAQVTSLVWLMRHGHDEWGIPIHAKGHRATDQTSCPGDTIASRIPSIVAAAKSEEDDMPYSKEELTDIVQDAIFKAGFGRTNPETFGDRVAAIRVDARAARAEVAALRAVVERIAKGDTMTDDEIAQVVRDAAKNIDVNVTVTQP